MLKHKSIIMRMNAHLILVYDDNNTYATHEYINVSSSNLKLDLFTKKVRFKYLITFIL